MFFTKTKKNKTNKSFTFKIIQSALIVKGLLQNHVTLLYVGDNRSQVSLIWNNLSLILGVSK